MSSLINSLIILYIICTNNCNESLELCNFQAKYSIWHHLITTFLPSKILYFYCVLSFYRNKYPYFRYMEKSAISSWRVKFLFCFVGNTTRNGHFTLKKHLSIKGVPGHFYSWKYPTFHMHVLVTWMNMNDG